MREILSDHTKIEFFSDPDPLKRAQKQMLTPLVKRVYKEVTVAQREGRYVVLLDGKVVKTPSRNDVALGTITAANLVATEFAAQEKEINPTKMPYTRLANTAIDGVANEIDAVKQDIIRFCGNDLICYRADAPDALVERQTKVWDKYINWVHENHGVRLILTQGVMHVVQPPQSLDSFSQTLIPYCDALSLSCLHAMTTILGSAVMALAVADGFVNVDEAWNDAHLDEDWTIENWGTDEEASHRRALRKVEMEAAAEMLAAVQKS